MISFAACSALSLSVTPGDSRSNLAPSVRTLIKETAGVLERIGASPNHRHGASVLYGRFLRELIRRGPSQHGQHGQIHTSMTDPIIPNIEIRDVHGQGQGQISGPGPSSAPAPGPGPTSGPTIPISQPLQPPTQDLWTEPIQFSAMSDDQIIDAVNRAGSAFGSSIPDVPFDDMLSWDWPDFANAEFSF